MLGNLSLSQLVNITKGKLINGGKNQLINQISIDSRQIYNPSNTLFVALQGAKAKGETFIADLVEMGVEVFLVSFEGSDKLAEIFKDAVFIGVHDTKVALQQIAKYIREQFDKPVVSITGSNGKTIVKEWLGQILSQSFAVAKRD
jgi:alanine racemase